MFSWSASSIRTLVCLVLRVVYVRRIFQRPNVIWLSVIHNNHNKKLTVRTLILRIVRTNIDNDEARFSEP